jgi:hypothetical protein
MKYKVVIILIPVTFLVGITYFLLVSKTKSKPKDSTNGFYSISIKDINEIDKYPEIKEFLMQNGYHEKLQKSIKEIQIGGNVYNNKRKLTKEIESAMIKKYSLDQPTHTNLNDTGITLIIKYDSNKIINDVQLKKEMND